MEEVNCPFCGWAHDFDTADIRDEGVVETVTCDECDKVYQIYLTITWDYHTSTTVL